MDSPMLYVDATSLSRPKLTGVGRCVARVIEALARRQELRLFSMARYEDLRDQSMRTGLHQGREIAVGPLNLPADTGDIQAWRDAVFSLPSTPFDHASADQSAGIYTFRRSANRHFAHEVSLYYDLTACLVPGTHELKTRREFTELAEQMIPLDDRLMAISKATRDDLIWLGGVPAEKVDWCHLGPSQCIGAHAWNGAKPVRDPHVFLVVSTLEPRKNPQLLMEWFLTSPHLPDEARLVWAGPAGWLVDQGGLPRARGLRRVDFVGMVSDAELCRLYSSARCLIYPSLYEGFGFPVLDALLHGTPVICSGNSSMLEFAGEGVHFVDPCDPDSFDLAWQSCRECTVPVERPDLRLSCTWDRFAARMSLLAA